jgi:hypothetical protein
MSAMATSGIGFDKVAQNAGTANENDEVTRDICQ